MVNDYTVRLMCPYGDDEQWVTLQQREESLKAVLETPWDFECPTHGVQHEFPLDARERIAPPSWSKLARLQEKLNRAAGPRPKSPKEPRFQRQVRVLVRGRDQNGNLFKQTAYSVNVSRTGARLHGLGMSISPGTAIELSRLFRRARYRVVWTGAPGSLYANELGLCSINPANNFWGVS